MLAIIVIVYVYRGQQSGSSSMRTGYLDSEVTRRGGERLYCNAGHYSYMCRGQQSGSSSMRTRRLIGL